MKAIYVAAVLLLLTAPLLPQTSLNPDISVIGNFRGYIHNDDSRPSETKDVKIADPELELMISGYLNPYAEADLVLGWHGEHSAEIEELYGTILRGLPLKMNLRVGKYLLEFGRLNPVHPHAYSFLRRPLPHESFFGEEGFNDVAARTSFYIPTGDAYTELMFAALQGDFLFSHEHDEEEAEHAHEEEGEEEDPGLGFFGRLATSFATGDFSELALGGSVANAVYSIEHEEHEQEGEALSHLQQDEAPQQLRAWLIGGDIKYKYSPSRYTTLQIEAEGLARVEELHDGDKLSSYGTYGYIDYRFRQKYNVGGILEWLRRKEAIQEVEDHEDEHLDETIAAASQEAEMITSNDTWRAGVFVGFAPLEETTLVRLAGHWTEPDVGDGFWELTLQFLFSLGPHKPHNF